jgi:radical SAM superfamily enzyme
MENKILCQSCSMPIEIDHVKGSERDGSKSNEYCMYCYENGAFKEPNMTLGQMISVVESQMEKMNLPVNLIEASVNKIPKLSRWKI